MKQNNDKECSEKQNSDAVSEESNSGAVSEELHPDAVSGEACPFQPQLNDLVLHEPKLSEEKLRSLYRAAAAKAGITPLRIAPRHRLGRAAGIAAAVALLAVGAAVWQSGAFQTKYRMSSCDTAENAALTSNEAAPMEQEETAVEGETGAAGGAQTETSQDSFAQLENPLVSVDSAEVFAEKLSLNLQAPAQAQQVSYTLLAGTTAQIDFTLDTTAYCLRGAPAAEAIEAASAPTLLAGVYETLTPLSFSVSGTAAEGTEVDAELFSTESGSFLAVWQVQNCTFTLLAENAQEADVAQTVQQLLTVCGPTE